MRLSTKPWLFRFYLSLLFTSLYASVARSQAPDTLQLWPEGAPGAMGTGPLDVPRISVNLPPKEKATGAAVVICPGGGYVTLAADHEGKQVAEWFNNLGIAAFVLRYRVNTWDHRKYGYPHAFNDATRAMRLVRSRAAGWGIDPGKIGILGFSAGGHLASTVGTHFDQGKAKAKDLVERAASRPNFLVLIYPVVSFTTEHTHRFSREMQLGRNLDSTLAEYLSNEKHVTTLTPPTFLMHTDDDGVEPENSVLFYLALRKARVPAEMHIYQKGGHGYGFYPKDNPALATWPDRLRDWLKGQGLTK
jgi:acetyl esterase/lipase